MSLDDAASRAARRLLDLSRIVYIEASFEETVMSEKVIASAELRAKLTAANGNAIELCDEAGNVIGYAVTPARLATIEVERREIMASLHSHWTDEEIARLEDERKNDPRPDVPNDEVLRWIEAQ